MNGGGDSLMAKKGPKKAGSKSAMPMKGMPPKGMPKGKSCK